MADRHFRRRVRCMTHGHRWRQDERLQGDVIVEAEQCLRCGRVRIRGERPAPTHLPSA